MSKPQLCVLDAPAARAQGPETDAASVLAQARTLAAEFAETATACDRRGCFPSVNITRLHEAGLLSLTVPRGQGGGGGGLALAGAVIGTIAAGEPSTALVLAMHYLQHAAIGRSRRWPDAVYAMVARSSVQKGALINALRVEPALGTPARGGLPDTIARRTANGWSLTGRKTFCTGAPVLRWLAVWARTEEETPRVGIWLVPAEARGVSVLPTWDHLGMRASESHDVVLAEVRVPATHAVDIRPPSDWAVRDDAQAAWNAVLIGALYHGVATAARNWLAQFLEARIPSNLGAPLSTLPRIASAFGEIESLLYSGGQLLTSAARAVDSGSPEAPDAVASGILKHRVIGDAINAVQQAVALIGNAGLTRANPLERHLRDVLCGRVHTPQDDSVLLAAGRAGLAQTNHRIESYA